MIFLFSDLIAGLEMVLSWSCCVWGRSWFFSCFCFLFFFFREIFVKFRLKFSSTGNSAFQIIDAKWLQSGLRNNRWNERAQGFPTIQLSSLQLPQNPPRCRPLGSSLIVVNLLTCFRDMNLDQNKRCGKLKNSLCPWTFDDTLTV